MSFECTPDLADDAEATIAQALELWRRLDQPNVMIKVPGTEAGLTAIEELTRLGVNVNVTLLFAVGRYEQVIDAYLRGLDARAEGWGAARRDRIGRLVLPLADRHQGRPPAARELAAARPRRDRQRTGRLPALPGQVLRPQLGPLARSGSPHTTTAVGSTGTKDPHYPDVLYVSELIGPDVVNTMPEKTLHAFADHGEAIRTVDTHRSAAEDVLAAARDAGVDLDHITAELEREGVRSFCDSYHQLLGCLQSKLTAWRMKFGR